MTRRRLLVAVSRPSSRARRRSPPAAQPPAAAGRPAAAPFRAGVDIVSLNVTVTDGAGRYVTDLDQAEFSVFEDGVKQEVTFFNRAAAADRAVAAARQQRQHGRQAADAAGGGRQLRQRLKPNDLAQVIDFDSRVEIRQAFTGNQAELERRSTRPRPAARRRCTTRSTSRSRNCGRSRAVDEEDVRRQALVVFSDGEDTSSLVSFDEVLDLAKRSETAIYTIALRGVDTQTQGLPRSRVRHAPAGAGNRRPRVLPGQDRGPERRLRADRRRARQPVHARLHVEEPAARRRLAPHRRAGRASRASRRAPRGATSPRRPGEPAPARPLRRGRRRLRDPLRAARAGGRPRRDDAAAARRARRTPSSSACRRWKCGTCRSPTRRAPSRRSSGC